MDDVAAQSKQSLDASEVARYFPRHDSVETAAVAAYCITGAKTGGVCAFEADRNIRIEDRVTEPSLHSDLGRTHAREESVKIKSPEENTGIKFMSMETDLRNVAADVSFDSKIQEKGSSQFKWEAAEGLQRLELGVGWDQEEASKMISDLTLQKLEQEEMEKNVDGANQQVSPDKDKEDESELASDADSSCAVREESAIYPERRMCSTIADSNSPLVSSYSVSRPGRLLSKEAPYKDLWSPETAATDVDDEVQADGRKAELQTAISFEHASASLSTPAHIVNESCTAEQFAATAPSPSSICSLSGGSVVALAAEGAQANGPANVSATREDVQGLPAAAQSAPYVVPGAVQTSLVSAAKSPRSAPE